MSPSVLLLLLLAAPSCVLTACNDDSFKTYATWEDYQLHNDMNEMPLQQVLMTDLAETYGAVALDGSAADFYYRPASNDAGTKFHIYLQGGGWCASIQNCADRATTTLGSSKYDGQYLNAGSSAPYLSSQSSINPLTYNWHSVFIRYLDGSSYSSNNETTLKYNDSITLHFRGRRILNAVLGTLTEKYNFSDATDVLLSGCSAGALGVFFHADYIEEYVSELKGNTSFNYMAMPDAGYFMEVSHYQMMMEWNYAFGNVTDGLNQRCVQSAAANRKQGVVAVTDCMYAVNLAPFVQSKVFSMQSQYDSNQIANMHSDDSLTINQYGANLTNWYLNAYIDSSPTHYGFLVSCYQHCTGANVWNNIQIKGYTQSQAQVDTWFANATYGQLLFQNDTYPCNACCS